MITDDASAREAAPRRVRHMWTGTLELDLLLGDVHSPKEKRSVVRPLVAELQMKVE